MGAEMLTRLATVFVSGGVALLVTLVCGAILVPLLNRGQFVSKELKEGVARARRDTVPMGGGFILWAGTTLVIIALTLLEQVRVGYAACFLIAFLGFGLLGLLDDLSKVRATGYPDRVKVVLQVTVTLTFAVCFYWYFNRYVSSYQLHYLMVPFVGNLPLGLGVVPAVMLFLFFVTNAVNITDGFNGLAGGTGAIVALAYAVVTFLIGAAEWANSGSTEIAIRMFALSRISAVVAGSLVAYLYFNYRRGTVYFGDAGSMSLGAALAFLAVFSRTELLLAVIGGVFFCEALSVFVQRGSVWVSQRVLDPQVQAVAEPYRPFIIAPLHHHFEHLLMREAEARGQEGPEVRRLVRQRITGWAWVLGLLFAFCGMSAEMGAYRRSVALYDWSCAIGGLLILAVLCYGMLTRYLYDAYYIAPDRQRPELLSLYRGVPWRLFGRQLSQVYEATDIPVGQLGFLERRTGLFRILYNRVDARIAFGLLHYEVGRRGEDAAAREHFVRALAFWEQVPLSRFLTLQRYELLEQMATACAAVGRYAQAVELLEMLSREGGEAGARAAVQETETITAAQEAATRAWTDWHAAPSEPARQAALAAHHELRQLLQGRSARAERVLERYRTEGAPTPTSESAITAQSDELADALALVTARCGQLQGGEAQP